MSKVTGMQLMRHARLGDAVDATRAAIYGAAPTNNVPFDQCLKLATPEQRDAHAQALQAIIDYEAQLIEEGRAWRHPTLGTFYFR